MDYLDNLQKYSHFQFKIILFTKTWKDVGVDFQSSTSTIDNKKEETPTLTLPSKY